MDRHARRLSIAELMGLLRRAGHRLCWLREERSRSGQGWHLTLRITPPCVNLFELIALQAVCGSDPYREANNTLRARQMPNVSSYWQRASAVNVFYDPVY